MTLDQILMIVLPVAGILLQAAHARGFEMPVLSAIFRALNGNKPPAPLPPPADPNAPALPDSADAPRFPILNAILQALSGGNKVSFTNDPDTGAQSLYVEPAKTVVKSAIAFLALALCASSAAAVPPCDAGVCRQRAVDRARSVERRAPCDDLRPTDPSVHSVASVPFFAVQRVREVRYQGCQCGPNCPCDRRRLFDRERVNVRVRSR